MLHKNFSSNPWIKPEYKLKRNTTARNGETSTEISRKFRHKLWLSVWFSPQQSCLPRTSLRRVLTLTASSTLRSSSTSRRWTPAASMTTRPSTRISAKPRNILVRAGCETQRGLSNAHLISSQWAGYAAHQIALRIGNYVIKDSFWIQILWCCVCIRSLIPCRNWSREWAKEGKGARAGQTVLGLYGLVVHGAGKPVVALGPRADAPEGGHTLEEEAAGASTEDSW